MGVGEGERSRGGWGLKKEEQLFEREIYGIFKEGGGGGGGGLSGQAHSKHLPKTIVVLNDKHFAISSS